MHPQLRHAKFNLVIGALALAPTLVSFIILGSVFGFPTAFASFGFCGLLGLWGLGGWFYRKKSGETAVVIDERDKWIRDRADLLAWRVVWLYWGLVCMGPWFWYALLHGQLETATINLTWLPLAYGGGMIVQVFCWSLAIVHQYREDSHL